MQIDLFFSLKAATNIALGQPAVHTQSLDFAGYMWEAGLAVDNGKPPFPDNNYENSKSCSCSIADGENTWTVYLDQPYVLQNVIVHGRSGKCFRLFFYFLPIYLLKRPYSVIVSIMLCYCFNNVMYLCKIKAFVFDLYDLHYICVKLHTLFKRCVTVLTV
jgi:hypothetical protein